MYFKKFPVFPTNLFHVQSSSSKGQKITLQVKNSSKGHKLSQPKDHDAVLQSSDFKIHSLSKLIEKGAPLSECFPNGLALYPEGKKLFCLADGSSSGSEVSVYRLEVGVKVPPFFELYGIYDAYGEHRMSTNSNILESMSISNLNLIPEEDNKDDNPQEDNFMLPEKYSLQPSRVSSPIYPFQFNLLLDDFVKEKGILVSRAEVLKLCERYYKDDLARNVVPSSLRDSIRSRRSSWGDIDSCTTDTVKMSDCEYYGDWENFKGS